MTERNGNALMARAHGHGCRKPTIEDNALYARMEFFAGMARSRALRSRVAHHIAWHLVYRHLNGTTGRCTTSIAHLVEETRATRDQVNRALRRLEKSGWWQIVKRDRDCIEILAKYPAPFVIQGDRP